MNSNYIRLSIISFFIILFVPSFSQINSKQSTLVISLDGFRWDYSQKTVTPNLDKIATIGVKAKSMVPSFPSKTFPNHYTMATGLVPDHHGLVNNSFFDPETKRTFSMSGDGRFDPYFYGGEPIWITAQKQGVKTASFFWVGSDVAIQGRHPDFWKPYDGDVPYSNRIDTIVKWLQMPEDVRPALIMAYFEEPDGVGHDFGPNDIRTFEKVQYLDSLVGILYKKIQDLETKESINIIIVSDHGMGPISTENNITITELLPKAWNINIQGGNPFYNLYVAEDYLDSAYQLLKNTEHLKTWKPNEVPSYLNYGTNPKVGDIIIVADSAWSLTMKKPRLFSNGGTHGYDIKNSDMHAIFYATGPSFKENYIQASFKNTDIYPLLAHILKIQPAKNDGNLSEVWNMLKP